MTLRFPNESRHYDEAMHAVRFWGHDDSMEAAFFVNAHALMKIQSDAAADEAGLLAAFDANRELIYKTAVKVYGRGRKGAYDLLPSDF
jgi:FAD/FMN-containing dehydrogenase